jgi:glucosamine-phosphate N-acetyltransferase
MYPSTQIWVYEENNTLLATGTLVFEHKFIHNICVYAHIEDICVSSSHRKQGLGKRLIRHLINQSQHCYKINLHCADDLVHFYESCGFEHKGNQMSLLLNPDIS